MLAAAGLGVVGAANLIGAVRPPLGYTCDNTATPATLTAVTVATVADVNTVRGVADRYPPPLPKIVAGPVATEDARFWTYRALTFK